MDTPSVIAGLGFSALSVLALVLLALSFSSYVKIVTVLSIVRLGLGFNSLAASFVVGSLALSLSLFVMYPTLLESTRAMDQAMQNRAAPANDQVRAAALNAGIDKWRSFLRKHAHTEAVNRFAEIAVRFDQVGAAASDEQLRAASQNIVLRESWRVLAPAFLVSELQEAFRTGLTLFLPFLVIDLFAAVALAGIGLERMNPAVAALPFKLLLFVLVDGWSLITGNLVSTYL